MKIGFMQYHPQFGEKKKNFQHLRLLTRGVKADLLVLPELFATGYTFTSHQEVESLAEPTDGETTVFLQELSRTTGAIIVGGFAEKMEGKIYNTAIVVKKAEILGIYRKVHLFYKEKLWFTPGHCGFQVFELENFKLGVMICFDWIFPEACRSLALQGAEIIAHPANLVLPYCQRAMITRSLENRVYTITANRYGEEKRGTDHFNFTGKSQITDPTGNLLASAPEQSDSIQIVEIDSAAARDKQLNTYNDLFKDRNITLYKL
ncbi:MAG: nitrilase-related carbon-nitrogen hydrolase [Promethearchaeota archaeon]